MKILIIGTGQEIPPKGWGAVEHIIWQHAKNLPAIGVEADILNLTDFFSIPWASVQASRERGPYDFVHFHYDIQWPQAKNLEKHLPCALTSHFPHLYNKEKYDHYAWNRILDYFTDDSHDNFNFVLNNRAAEFYKSAGANPDKIFFLKNGADEAIVTTKTPKFPNKTIYLSKIAERKNQHKYGSFEDIDFAGNLNEEDENASTDILKNYLGEWTRNQVENNLCDYANLALLSNDESTTPLVVREALVAGLGVVITNVSTDEVDVNLPFISVIPDDKLDDLDYVSNVLKENREISIKHRSDIREYGIKEFSWKSCVKLYKSEIERALDKKR